MYRNIFFKKLKFLRNDEERKKIYIYIKWGKYYSLFYIILAEVYYYYKKTNNVNFII